MPLKIMRKRAVVVATASMLLLTFSEAALSVAAHGQEEAKHDQHGNRREIIERNSTRLRTALWCRRREPKLDRSLG